MQYGLSQLSQLSQLSLELSDIRGAFFLSFVCHQWVYLSLNLDLLCVCSPDLSCKAVEVVYAIQCHPGSYRVVGG